MVCGASSSSIFFYFMNRSTESNPQVAASVQRQSEYTDRLPDGFRFSTEYVALLDEMQLICYEIAHNNAYMQYQGHTFDYQIMLSVDAKTGLASGYFTIQPGGDWNNDFNIIMSIEDKRVCKLVEKNFEVMSDGHILRYKADGIQGIGERLGFCKHEAGQWSSTYMQVGFQSMISAWSEWCGASPNIECQVVKSKLADNRNMSGEIIIDIVYRYGVKT